jgi:hypothetical protein
MDPPLPSPRHALAAGDAQPPSYLVPPSQGKKLSEDDLPLAPLPGPAPPSVRDATPLRRQASSASESALPRTPQTGTSSRAAMSPAGTPHGADPGTPRGGGGPARTLAFSPAAGGKQPVPRFDGAEGARPGPTTPGSKRNALGLEIPRPSPRGAPPADGGLLSPRVGAGIRPSRLCFDSAADEAPATAPPAAAVGGANTGDRAAPRGRRLSFDAPAGGRDAPTAQAPEGLQREGSSSQPPALREGSGFGGARSLSGGLQFELKASTMAVSHFAGCSYA